MQPDINCLPDEIRTSIRGAHAATRRGVANLIIAAVCHRRRVSVEDVMRGSTSERVVAARHEAIRQVAAEFPDMKTSQLARIFGRHRSTISLALGRGKRKAKVGRGPTRRTTRWKS